jgi:hypothetical protein
VVVDDRGHLHATAVDEPQRAAHREVTQPRLGRRENRAASQRPSQMPVAERARIRLWVGHHHHDRDPGVRPLAARHVFLAQRHRGHVTSGRGAHRTHLRLGQRVVGVDEQPAVEQPGGCRGRCRSRRRHPRRGRRHARFSAVHDEYTDQNHGSGQRRDQTVGGHPTT